MKKNKSATAKGVKLSEAQLCEQIARSEKREIILKRYELIGADLGRTTTRVTSRTSQLRELIRKLESLSNNYRVIALIFRDGEAILALAGYTFADGMPSGGKSLQNLGGIRRRFTASLTPLGDLLDILRDSCGEL